MALSLPMIARGIGGLLPSVRAERRVKRLHELVRRVDHIVVGSSATYVGNNRVLVRIIAGIHIFILYVHADDKLISPWLIAEGRYEPDLTAYLVDALGPDSHCLDVGANLGYFTVLMAKYCPRGRVVALEPNPAVHALNLDNILINALQDRVELLNVAAGDAAGEVMLFHRIGRAGNTSIAACGEEFTRELREPPEEPFRVPMVRIDDLRARLDGRIDFLKMDVEGAEPLAFAGARGTIAANPQLQVIMEWAPAQIRHAGFDIADFVRDIAATGLRPSVLTGRTPQPISCDDLVNLPYQPGVLLRHAPA